VGAFGCRTAVREAIEQAAEFALSRHVMLKSAPVRAAFVLGRKDLVVKAFQAVLETAVKFSKADETVELSDHSSANAIQIAIKGCGYSIPAACIPKLFDVFSVGEAITPGSALGLDAPVAHRILKLFGGAVIVNNRHPSGIQITMSLRCGSNLQAINSEQEAAFEPA
jgi:K+-sensing histidine kinase KdpD